MSMSETILESSYSSSSSMRVCASGSPPQLGLYCQYSPSCVPYSPSCGPFGHCFRKYNCEISFDVAVNWAISSIDFLP